MDITGKITHVLPLKQGVSASGKAWSRQEFILQYSEGQYPKSIKFGLMGDKINQFPLSVGQQVKVYADFETNSYTSRSGELAWGDNRATAWKVESASVEMPPQPNAASQMMPPTPPMPNQGMPTGGYPMGQQQVPQGNYGYQPMPATPQGLFGGSEERPF